MELIKDAQFVLHLPWNHNYYQTLLITRNFSKE